MPSSHPSAQRLVASGLFDDVAAFTDLEGRIGGLGDEHTTAIGDAFEIFFEAFLATQPIMQADRTWLVKRVDPDVRRLLNLPADAKGIDGVYRSARATTFRIKSSSALAGARSRSPKWHPS